MVKIVGNIKVLVSVTGNKMVAVIKKVFLKGSGSLKVLVNGFGNEKVFVI